MLFFASRFITTDYVFLLFVFQDLKQSSPKEKEGEAKSTVVAAVSTTETASAKKPLVEVHTKEPLLCFC